MSQKTEGQRTEYTEVITIPYHIISGYRSAEYKEHWLNGAQRLLNSDVRIRINVILPLGTNSIPKREWALYDDIKSFITRLDNITLTLDDRQDELPIMIHAVKLSSPRDDPPTVPPSRSIDDRPFPSPLPRPFSTKKNQPDIYAPTNWTSEHPTN